jgi:nitrogen fixation/metabolism regulation signal transduction histidine kinase
VVDDRAERGAPMKLQSKLTLAFAAVALMPIVALTAVARVVVAERYSGEFKHTLEAAADQVEQEYRRLGHDVEAATDRLAHGDDRLIHSISADLAFAEPIEGDRARELKELAAAEMRTLGLDLLEVVDLQGEVLAAAHFPGRVGDSDPEVLRVARQAPGRARLLRDRVMDGGRAREQLVIEVVRGVDSYLGEGHTARLVVMGGRVLGDELVARLHPSARLYAPDGTLLVARAGAAPPARWPRRKVDLLGVDGEPRAYVEIAISDEELRDALGLISWATGALALAGVMLALLVGAAVARRIAGPLDELAEGARAVARGSLSASVPVRTRDEIGELAATFNAMTRDLSTAREELVRAERVAAWREIAQRIAHEIKNPLTPIQMAVETLQRAHQRGAPQFDALFAESAETVLAEVARLKHIVAEFSAFARMPQPKLQPLDLSQLVDGALALYKGGETRLTLKLERDLPPALADRDQLTQVVINLVENARDAVGGVGCITVTTRAADAAVEIEVADDGPGLSDEARAKLFTPYFTTKAKGTGLGLAIVHRIVSDHGGEIRVDGQPGAGARFTVVLRAMPLPASP